MGRRRHGHAILRVGCGVDAIAGGADRAIAGHIDTNAAVRAGGVGRLDPVREGAQGGDALVARVRDLDRAVAVGGREDALRAGAIGGDRAVLGVHGDVAEALAARVLRQNADAVGLQDQGVAVGRDIPVAVCRRIDADAGRRSASLGGDEPVDAAADAADIDVAAAAAGDLGGDAIAVCGVDRAPSVRLVDVDGTGAGDDGVDAVAVGRIDRARARLLDRDVAVVAVSRHSRAVMRADRAAAVDGDGDVSAVIGLAIDSKGLAGAKVADIHALRGGDRHVAAVEVFAPDARAGAEIMHRVGAGCAGRNGDGACS